MSIHVLRARPVSQHNFNSSLNLKLIQRRWYTLVVCRRLLQEIVKTMAVVGVTIKRGAAPFHSSHGCAAAMETVARIEENGPWGAERHDAKRKQSS